MIEKTATQINVERMKRERAFTLLSDHPHLQAEKIAKHYLSLVACAQQIQRLIEIVKHGNCDDSTSAHDAIKYFVDEIKRNHVADFGIPLEWPKI